MAKSPLKQKNSKSTFGGTTDTPDQIREEEATNQLMDEGKINRNRIIKAKEKLKEELKSLKEKR